MTPLILPRAALSVLVVSACALAACGSDADPAAPGTVALTQQDSGRTVSVRSGDRITVTLESNQTTGFAWQLTVEPSSDVLSVEGSEYVAPDTDLVGAGGQEVWRFRVVGEGATSLELTYRRSFSGEEAGDPFEIDVESRTSTER